MSAGQKAWLAVLLICVFGVYGGIGWKMAASLPLWAFLIFVGLIIGAYFLGHSDGRLREREDAMFNRMDELIAKIPGRADAEGQK